MVSRCITIADIEAVKKALDKANVPKHDRQMAFLGTDGEVYTVYIERPFPPELREVLPEWIKIND